MKTQTHTYKNILVAVALTVLLGSCNFFEDFPPPPEPPPQTRILRVEILPNDTLAPGDTATFRCIIADSLDSRFEFFWALDGDGNPDAIVTDNNQINWVVPSNTRSYRHSIRVGNGSEDSASVFKEFTVEVQDQ